MPEWTNLSADVRFQRFHRSADDLTRKDAAELRHLFFHLCLIRNVEERLLELKDFGLIHGPVHSSIGQEGGAVGAMQPLGVEDVIASTHRGHHHMLAKVYNAFAGTTYDPLESVPDAIGEVTERTMAEIMGLATGYCKGRGGSMHVGVKEAGCLGTNAIVAGGVPCAAGMGWAAKLDGTGHAAVAFMGDGAINQGVVFETFNMAALWNAPVVFFVENNLYAVATHIKDACAVSILAQRGLGFGIPSFQVDGMDPVAVWMVMEEALDHAVKQKSGPVLVEALTYRYKHQSQSLPGSAYGYRTRNEEGEWQTRDPYVQFPTELMDAGVLTEEGRDELIQRAQAIVDDATKQLTREWSPGVGQSQTSPTVPPELYPTQDDLYVDVQSDGSEFAGTRFAERSDFSEMEERKLIDVIPEVIRRRVDQDERIVIMGEEVGNMRGGVFMATKGIFKTYPERVVNTPISEGGFSGMALGLALSGKRPIVELMYPDFTLVAADQIFNQIGKFRYMYGGQHEIPLVLRTKVGIGTGYGAQHSMEPAPLYALYPGWRIVAPATPFDYVGLFNAAMQSEDPVLVIEHHMLYDATGPAPADRDYFIELGTADVKRAGDHVTLVAYSYMTTKALAAAEELAESGVSCEVIDLRTVDYAHIDYDAIGASVRKTGRVILLEEGLICGGIGGHLAWEIQRRFFDYLDAEIARVAAAAVPIPVSRVQEERALPQVQDIVQAARDIVA